MGDVNGDAAMPVSPKKPTQTAIDLRAHESRIIAEAVGWVAFIQVAPGDRRRVDAPSQERAIAAGVELVRETGRRLAMIYAYDRQGHDTMAGTVDIDGVFKSALTPA